MPNRWPISTGNWSNAAIWSGSLIPTASDDVWANGFNVFVDQDITARTLRNHPVSSPVILAGGSFITTGSRTIICTLTNDGGPGVLGTQGTVLGGFVNYSSTSSVLIVTGSDTVNIVSDIMGGLTVPPYGFAVVIRNSGIVNITGSIAGYTNQGLSIDTVPGGTVNILGDVRGNYRRGGGGAPSYGMTVTSAKTVNIIGDITGEGGSSGTGILLQSAPPLTINIKGNVYSKFGNNSIISSGASTGTINITGSVYVAQGATVTSIAIVAGNSYNINVSGSVTSNLASAISHTVPGNSSIIGPILSSVTAPAVQFSSATHFLTATGPFYNTNNRNAVFAQNLQLLSGSTTSWTFDTETALEQRTLYTADFPGNFPSASNVRQGTVFGNTGQFTGTVAIPSASNVLKGVPVGNTTGSASFNTQNVWSILTSSLSSSNSLGERLRNTSTVATDGILITSKGTL